MSAENSSDPTLPFQIKQNRMGPEMPTLTIDNDWFFEIFEPEFEADCD